ncbi:WD40 repeat-containing protein [Leptolyngbya sp. PCC 7375]|nr:WD40 repeat-containing protein [Leptolyngbya sp. PCC 7375]
MEFIIDKVIDAVLETSGIKEKVGRNQHVLRLLQRFGLDSLTSLTSFEDVYAYALVEYAFDKIGICKPKELIQFFKSKEVRDVFQSAYRQNDPGGWLRKGEEIAQFKLGGELPQLDPKRELGIFAAVFIQVVKQTRSPKEIRQEQKLDSLQRQLKTLQTQLQNLPTLEAINQQINQLTGADTPTLPTAAQNSQAIALANQLGEWFEVLEYDREPNHEVWETNYFEWIINFPITRRKFSRILVRGVTGEVSMADLQEFQQAIKNTNTDEGWLVSYRRVSKAARTAAQQEATYADITCYTFDELLDEDADFGRYLEWLEEEIKAKGIDTGYLPLSCRKDELSPNSQQKIGVSVYGEEDGWIDGYVDQWLADPAKEHLSVLGEFGTGKTWFALHYAWIALQRYQDAKKRGIERPRVPIVVPLRDYAKAVTVESLLSEFFFRKHEILKNYSVFEQLNRMGKLLLIFDGFDEMAARVNQQAMIDNFWELSKVVVSGAKAILTCRTEHFPDAIAGRQLLNAELQASTKNLTGEPPQFEVLELEKFSDEQISKLLKRKAQGNTVSEVMSNAQLLDLARRPVMVDLILEALPEIETGKPVDMARIYLYAVTAKMARDIKSERTFTSLADKLYFLCELSWAMLSTDRMSLNYQAFPGQLEQLFSDRIKEKKELDHWRYDMMGQTMLIRNSEGDYSPAHRSLLEFFAAYKIVASLGAMAEDFTAIAQQQSYIDQVSLPRDYAWSDYFRRSCNGEGIPNEISPLGNFKGSSFEDLLPLLSQSKLTKAILDLAHLMLDEDTMREQLLSLILETRFKDPNEVGYLAGNIVQLMLAQKPDVLVGCDLSKTKLKGIDLSRTYLRRVNFQEAHLTDITFSKSTNSIRSLTFSPDSKYLAIGDFKNTVQIWDIVTGQVVWFCLGHSDWVASVTFSSDGKLLASGSDDHVVKLWSTNSGKCIRTFTGHSGWVLSVAFSSDTKTLVSASKDHTIKLWCIESGKCLRTFEGHSDSVWSVAISPDGKTLASGSRDRTIKLWSLESGDCILTFEGHTTGVLSIAISPDGNILASSSGDHSVKLWSLESGDCLRTLNGHTDGVWAVTFSPDGKKLASGSQDRVIKVWSTHSGDCLDTLEGHSDWVLSLAFKPDGQMLASGSDDQTVKLWSLESGNCIRTLTSHSHALLSIAYSPDGTTLASGGDDQTVKLWATNSGNCIRTFEGHLNAVRAVAFSPDGRLLASSSNDQTVKLWSLESGNCIHTYKGHQSSVRAIAFSPDGRLLASSSNDQKIKLWATDSGECIHTYEGHSSLVLSLAFSPDGKTLASGSNDSTVKLWVQDSDNCFATLQGHSTAVRTVAFSPDGNTLASGGSDKTICLWSINLGNCIHTLQGHTKRIWSVEFSPDGKTLASGSDDQTAKLWSVDSGDCINTFENYSDRVRTVVFSPDGKELALGSEDETIRFWNVKTGVVLHTIDERVCAGMNITDVVGLTAGQQTALKLMGAIDQNDEVENFRTRSG